MVFHDSNVCFVFLRLYTQCTVHSARRMKAFAERSHVNGTHILFIIYHFYTLHILIYTIFYMIYTISKHTLVKSIKLIQNMAEIDEIL